MRVRVQMTGVLKSMEPEDGYFDCVHGMTIDELLHTLDVHQGTSSVSLNHELCQDRDAELKDGDWVCILGYVGGG